MEGVGDEGSGTGDGLVDGGSDVIGGDNGLAVGEVAGAGGLRMNEGEGRKQIFREF